MIALQSLIFFLLFMSIWTSGLFAQRSSYGESCDDTLKCDKRAWLTCRNGTCDCMKPDVMMYEESIKKCASKAGERCKVIFEALDGNNLIYEMMDCVENSNCTSDGFCACDNKYYENLNGTCTPAQSHMETCDSVVKCSKYEALQCFDGLCKCNETVSTFYSNGESSDGQCLGLAGESCINSKCVEHSTCSNATVENVCICDDDFYQDDEKKCLPKIAPLERCTNHSECMIFRGSQLVCKNNLCDCDPRFSRYGTAQRSNRNNWYHGQSNYDGDHLTQCAGLAGSPCIDRLCVLNSYCDFNRKDWHNHDNSGTCRCRGAFTRSSQGTCLSPYDGSCTKSEDCAEGLFCKESKCKCPFNDQAFDSSANKCVSKVDGPCNSSTLCVTYAECLLFSRIPIEVGHCSCKSGFIKNSHRGCSAKFGQPCTSKADCDSVASLVCTSQVCECDDFAKYSKKYRKCLGLVGANCDLNSSEPQCVENSKCERVHPRLQGVCSCPSGSGFKETSEYSCEVENEIVKKSPAQDEQQQTTTLPPLPIPVVEDTEVPLKFAPTLSPVNGNEWG